MSTKTTSKKNTTIIFIVSSLVIVGIFGLLYSKKSQDQGDVIATVNDTKIYRKQVENKLTEIFQSQGQLGKPVQTPDLNEVPQEILKIVAREIYVDQKILKKSKKAGIENKKSVKEEIAKLKKRIIIQGYIDDVVEKEVNDQLISETYLNLSNEMAGKKEYELHHIVFKDEKLAKRTYSQLKRRPDRFAYYAKRHSIDKQSGKEGGKIGFIIEDSLAPEMITEIKELKKNRPSKPIKTSYGWHIIKYSDSKDAKALPFENVKEAIRNQLVQKKINDTKNDLFNDAEINILFNSKNTEEEATKVEEKEEETQEPKDSQTDQ